MTGFVALLRAVNVGGTGKLAMTELKAMCEAAGFESVRTYIASGNVVFASGLSEAEVKAELERRLQSYAGKPVAVMIRTKAELDAVIAGNPFPDAKPNQLLVTFLDEKPADDAAATARHQTDERIATGRREIYVHYSGGMGASKLVVPAAKTGTARNLNTVAKLAAMAAELGG